MLLDLSLGSPLGKSHMFHRCGSNITPQYSRLSAKNVKLLRPTLFNYIYTREELQQYAQELWDFIEKDGLNVKIHEVYPLKNVEQATKDIEGRKTTGKLLLQP